MTPDDAPSDDALAALAHRAAQWPDAPRALVQAAIGLWPAAAPFKGVRGLLREVLAVLRFDSAGLATPQAAGMRGGPSEDRHLLYSAEGHDLDLRISADGPGHWRLSGQVLGPEEAGTLWLSSDSNPAAVPVHQTTLDALGEFELAAVPAGRWLLALQLGERRIVLPPLDVGVVR